MAENYPVSGIIARADARGKILDFRDNLVLAYPEDYAMLQGVGGSKHAASSGIKTVITDYSEGKDKKSVTVSANIKPDEFEIIKAVCQKNFGTPVVATENVGLSEILEISKNQIVVGNAFGSLLSNLCAALGDIVTGKASGDVKGIGMALGRAFKEAKKAFNSPSKATDTPSNAPVEVTYDYAYKQEKVNMYRANDKGLVFVSAVNITRQGWRQTGEKSKMPWTVKVSNFYAAPNKKDNGTTAYIGSTATDKTEAFIMLTDDDMFRCCNRIEHFVRIWENSACIPMVARAIAEKEAYIRQTRENKN